MATIVYIYESSWYILNCRECPAWQSCVPNCHDQSYLRIILCSSNIRAFIHPHAFFTNYRYITNSQSDQLPVGFIVQLVEHCTGIAEVMSSNAVHVYKPITNTSSSFWQAYNAGNHADFTSSMTGRIRWFARFPGPTSKNPCRWPESCFSKRLLGSFWFACFQNKNKDFAKFHFL